MHTTKLKGFCHAPKDHVRYKRHWIEGKVHCFHQMSFSISSRANTALEQNNEVYHP